MVIDHPQAPLNGKVVVAENIGALHTEQENHLRSPHADPLQRPQGFNGVLVGHPLHGGQIKSAGVDFFGKIRDVLRLAEGHAQRLQLRDARRKNGLGVHFHQRVLHPLPDGGLCLRGDLLADDVVNDGGKKVGIYGAVDVADLVNDRAEPLVLPAQIGNFRFPVCKIHVYHLLHIMIPQTAKECHKNFFGETATFSFARLYTG